eukprot:m.20409 g.20409  ORF g.20409 m.20409 type:complete len:248 (+) comp3530_c0_seq1:31-774(+)
MAQRAKADKDKKAEWKEEDTLQAIVIADSFNQRFSPLTAYEPRTLLPLVNVCLLDYTLEFLTAAGVQEVILFCCSFADKIKAHVAKSKWSKIVTPVVSEKCLSIGDALREIDRSGTIRSNFILVTGDIVSNYKLGALEDHKNRLKADKDAVMTMLFKKANPRHPARSIEDDLLVSLDKSSGRYSVPPHLTPACSRSRRRRPRRPTSPSRSSATGLPSTSASISLIRISTSARRKFSSSLQTTSTTRT